MKKVMLYLHNISGLGNSRLMLAIARYLTSMDDFGDGKRIVDDVEQLNVDG